MRPGPLPQDIDYLDHMRRGSEWLLRNIQLARGERQLIGRRARQSYGNSDLIWSWVVGGTNNPDGQAMRRQIAHAEASRIEHDRVEGLRVQRDPCPMCGVRGDLSCKHRRAG